MAIGVWFDKAKAQGFLDALNNGKAIECQDPAGWIGRDMLLLGGALFFGALSQGPQLYRDTDWSKAEFATSSAGREQTCHRKLRIAWL